MNPALEMGLGEFAVRRRNLPGRYVELDEAQRASLRVTQKKFWQVAANRGAKRGMRSRQLECGDYGTLFDLLGATSQQRQDLANSSLVLELQQDSDEPDTRRCIVFAVENSEGDTAGGLREPLFTFYVDKVNGEESRWGGLSIATGRGLQQVLPDTPEHTDIEAIAECFLPVRRK